MTDLYLEQKYIDFIKETIYSVLEHAHIYIFGSRVQGNAQEFSDVDIALDTKNVIDIKDILTLKSIFRNSTFPYKVDIIDINSTDKKFLKIIESDLYEI